MFRIICTSEKEKADWMEASEILSKMTLKEQTVLKFLAKLYKEPGTIEISERMILPSEMRKYDRSLRGIRHK